MWDAEDGIGGYRARYRCFASVPRVGHAARSLRAMWESRECLLLREQGEVISESDMSCWVSTRQ